MSSSERKKKRLAALEAKRSHPAVEASKKSKRVETSGTETAPVSTLAQEGGGVVQGANLYSRYQGVASLFPWIEDDVRKLQDVTHELLQTNPRCRRRNASGVVDKMKEKTLLLDNPDVKRGNTKRTNCYVKSVGISKATRKELKELGVLNVNGMGLTHDHALMLHRLWKEYRDSLLEKTVSKKDFQERMYAMDRHGAHVVFQRINSHTPEPPVSGIIVADTQSSVHVIDATGKYHIASKASSMYSIEINSEQMITFLPVE